MKHYQPNKPNHESQSVSVQNDEKLSTSTQPALSSSNTSKKNKTRRVIIAFVLALVIITFAIIAYLVIRINLPYDPSNTEKSVFKVEANSGIDQIATNLQQKGFISDKNLFIIYAKFGPSRGNLKPGVYMFSPSMSIASIADTLGIGKIATKKVTFQEGLTINEIARKWAREGFGDAQAFVDATKLQGAYKQSFLQYRSNQASLEGYLFPATYDIVVATSPEQQISAMLNSFASQVLPKLDPSVANSKKLNEIVTLASIVEKEANTTEDRKLVAGVFYNRLAKGMRLESDVTVNYATGKSETSPQDTRVDSPYNTYIVAGLPLGPICNPSLDAILATANPTPSDYYYFIADKKGIVRYAKTYQEHLQNIEKYLN
jgi:UPF0755 protein